MSRFRWDLFFVWMGIVCIVYGVGFIMNGAALSVGPSSNNHLAEVVFFLGAVLFSTGVGLYGGAKRR